jgi:hypothetical protein
MTFRVIFVALLTENKSEEPANDPEPPGFTPSNTYQIRDITEFIR